uniref:uncharacterized protein LOC122585944 n=1 Tax=Erigeron canadensis TaxID=72917 RepID=UPI001CB907F3|nr:uncharacterized protein LOC122585944 [Erigeron canadensis]
MIFLKPGVSLAILAPMGGGPAPVRFGWMESKPLPMDPYKKNSASRYSRFKANSIRSLSDIGNFGIGTGMVLGSGSGSGDTKGKRKRRKRNAVVIIGPTVVAGADGVEVKCVQEMMQQKMEAVWPFGGLHEEVDAEYSMSTGYKCFFNYKILC